MYISKEQVPEAIKSFSKSVLGVDLKEFSIEQTGEINVHMPWHEACYEYYKLFKVVGENKVEETDFSFKRAGIEGDGVVTGKELEGKTKIPNGFLIVRVSTYPKICRIYTSDNCLKLLPKEDVSLCEEECLLLSFAKSLIPSARPKLNQKFYDSLISKGYMKRNKSITMEGKNILMSSYVQTVLKNHVNNNGTYRFSLHNIF